MSKLNAIYQKYMKKFLKKFSPTYNAVLRIESSVKAYQRKQDALFWYQIMRDGETLSETKQRFFRSMPCAEGDLRKLQLIILDMLKQIDTICRNNNLSYWLMGGSLIGAIRHDGFIPWDDDADIGMTRSDFIKFKSLCDQDSKIEVMDYYNFNGQYRIPKVVLKGIDNVDFCVDIIIMDETNAEYGNHTALWAENRKIRKKLQHRLIIEKKLRYRDFWHTQRLNKEPERKNHLDQILDQAVQQCGYTGDGNTLIWGVDNFNSSAVDKTRLFKREDILPCAELQFENNTFYVPAKFEDFSHGEVGDYYSIPSSIGKMKFYNDKKLKSQLDALSLFKEGE